MFFSEFICEVSYKIQGYSVESGKSDLRTYFFRDTFSKVCAKILPVIWCAGIAVTALIFAVSNLRLYFRLKQRRRRIEADCPLPVYAVENLSSSCLFGRAVYVSAETAENAAQLRCVLAHELSRILTMRPDEYRSLCRQLNAEVKDDTYANFVRAILKGMG